MRTQEAAMQPEEATEEIVVDEEGNERRRAFRRKLPFGRGAVLVIAGRAHIVGLADLSVTGAYLRTVAPVAVGETHTLRLLLLPDRSETEFDAEIVRIAQSDGESSDHSRGIAVRFTGLTPDKTERLEAFISRRPRNSAAR